MAPRQHQDMRTTLTLDDDVAAKLKEEARATGKSFKEVVNDSIRVGLLKQTKSMKPFKVRDVGFRLGVDFTSTSRLLEELEGPFQK